MNANIKPTIDDLISAIRDGDLKRINILLEDRALRAKASSNGGLGNNTLLRLAAIQGHLDVLNRLLEFPAITAKADLGRNSALRLAALHGHLDIVNRLLEIPAVMKLAADANNAALQCAIENNHTHVIERLHQIAAVREFEAA